MDKYLLLVTTSHVTMWAEEDTEIWSIALFALYLGAWGKNYVIYFSFVCFLFQMPGFGMPPPFMFPPPFMMPPFMFGELFSFASIVD